MRNIPDISVVASPTFSSNRLCRSTIRTERSGRSRRSRMAAEAPEMRWHHWVLEPALAPGARTDFRFDLEYGAQGFANDGADAVVLANGTFLNPGLTP